MDTHREAEELLPWYATGEIDADDRALVEAHLASCAHCQRQLQAERRLADEYKASVHELDSGWTRLRGRIEAPARHRPIRRTFAEMWQILSRPAVAALATAQIALVAIAAAVIPSLGAPAYVALGDKPAAAATSANVVVMFRPEATEADMRGALKASGASLVGGPTAADAYLLHVPASQRTSALARLGADDDVTMAQPIDGAAQ